MNIPKDRTKHDHLQQTLERIKEKKRELGKKIVLLTHHYQRMEIVDLGDFVGDSLALSREASLRKESPSIVFCGVHFMAESAAVLAQDHQRVHLPNLNAGCPMADMSNLEDVERAWGEINGAIGEGNITPITYMNSTADLKAFCGRNGGCVNTSTNARAVFEWALKERGKILFFPDEHLGRNTARKMGIPREKLALWNWKEGKEFGGNSRKEIESASVILWQGYCHVHTHFTVADIRAARGRYPDCKIVVHPECPEEVVGAADADGSTEFICNYVKSVAPGSTVIVGTEINLINRLARNYPDRQVFELSRSLCPNMYKINPDNLLETLEHLDFTDRIVTVPDRIKADARLALERMLAIGKGTLPELKQE